MSYGIIFRLRRPLFHCCRHNCNPTTHASPSWGSSPACKTRNSPLNRRFRSSPRHPRRTCPIWHPNRIHLLAQHLLALFRPPILNPHPPLALHARLSRHQPRRTQLLLHALVDSPHAPETPRARPILHNRLPHLHNLHLLLDNPNLPARLPALLLLPARNRLLRLHRHRRPLPRPFLRPRRNRPLRPPLQRHPRRMHVPHRHPNRHLHRHLHRRWPHHPSLRHRPWSSEQPNRKPLSDLRDRAEGT